MVLIVLFKSRHLAIWLYNTSRFTPILEFFLLFLLFELCSGHFDLIYSYTKEIDSAIKFSNEMEMGCLFAGATVKYSQ